MPQRKQYNPNTKNSRRKAWSLDTWLFAITAICIVIALILLGPENFIRLRPR